MTLPKKKLAGNECFAGMLSEAKALCIDAGVNTIKIAAFDRDGKRIGKFNIPSNQNLSEAIKREDLDSLNSDVTVYMTGKLQAALYRSIGRGERILASAALWAAARSLSEEGSLGILEISSSGYMIVGIDSEGNLKEDMLIVNPRCGAGSGVNLDRVLQKLDIPHSEVDSLLRGYIGEENCIKRQEVNIRADRCGVFASSATISDKNQGIPLDFALAVTLKSEVLKACKKFPSKVDTVWLTGGIFRWQFARDCAKDYFEEIGVGKVRYDREGELPIRGLRYLERSIGEGNFAQSQRHIVKRPKLTEYPAMYQLLEEFSSRKLYHRIPNMAPTNSRNVALSQAPVILGLDVGSTMAKLVISDSSGREILHKGSYSNAGDTIDTIKQIFLDLKSRGIDNILTDIGSRLNRLDRQRALPGQKISQQYLPRTGGQGHCAGGELCACPRLYRLCP